MQISAENEQKQDSIRPDLSVRFLAVFNNNSGEATFPEFTYGRSGTDGSEVMRCLEPAELEGTTSSCLHMLHPQARNFIAYAVTHFRLAGPLSRELQKTIWKAKAPSWAAQRELGDVLKKQDDGWVIDLKIANIGAVLFPTNILMLHVDVFPAFKLFDVTALPAAKLLLHSLVRAGRSFSDGSYKGLALKRTRQEQCESAMQRMGANSNELIQGFCGKEVTLVDMVKGLLPNECFTDTPTGRSCSSAFLMGDRFLAYTFLKTNWDGHGEAFNEQDHIDLIRLSRAEDDKYKPARDPISADNNAIIKTFENVAFSPSSEGVVCWVKPRKEQDFLHQQFKRDRYETIYFQLYLLALHQRYALVNLAKRLDDATPTLEDLSLYCGFTHDGRFEKIVECAERMRLHRTDVSNFYLRAFFQQPATLTSHQQFYHSLQKVLGVSDLLDEVRQAASEFEYLIGSLHERASLKRHQEGVSKQAEQHKSRLRQIAKLISEQEKSAKSHFALTLAVEFFAIPYYMFNFLVHGLHLPEQPSVIASGVVTFLIITSTVIYTYMNSRNHKTNREVADD